MDTKKLSPADANIAIAEADGIKPKRYDVARLMSDENLIALQALQGDKRIEMFDAIVDDVIKRSTSPQGTDTSH